MSLFAVYLNVTLKVVDEQVKKYSKCPERNVK